MFKTTRNTLICSILLCSFICLQATALHAEEGEKPVKKVKVEKHKKAKAGNASGVVTAIDADAKTITLSVKNHKSAEAETDAAAESITITCDEKTKIKSGAEDVELSAIPLQSKVMVKYDAETNVAHMIRVKGEKKKEEAKTDTPKEAPMQTNDDAAAADKDSESAPAETPAMDDADQ